MFKGFTDDEKVGYKIIKHEKNILMKLSGQGSAFIMEYNTPNNMSIH